MSSIGAQLKKEREAQQKTRADVARQTGILIHQLSALEHGSFDTLPDDATVAGFVKVYAEFLGFEPGQPVAEFWAERGVEPAPADEEPPVVESPPTVGSPEPVEPVVESDEDAPAAPSVEAEVESSIPVGVVDTSSPSDMERAGMRWLWIPAVAAAVVVLAWFTLRGDAEPVEPAVDPAPAAVEPVAAEPVAPVEVEQPPSEPAASAPAEDRPLPEPPAPPARTPEVASTSGLRVDHYGVGTGVKDRQLVGESDRFRLGTKVWFQTRVEGGAAGDLVRHVWIHEAAGISTIELRVGSANWRTHSAKTMFDGSVGRWTVEALDENGRVLARREFVCVP